ncbi:extracellular solute-binding protein family 1 [Beutenbergia cavernae DSM 12333]|uniref:Extracellular solute-binding protein family 1 n=1 Tax=Beutenbergia cavernae (strain ATCC BAA-8 / DSM 12333 / CCUG 43141 / JCM 11478 / NBRC 16432 / NCIMB 13614 / HKI 0122) TaxID=471853 RepID=C5C1W0_BEUC1|nr:extracellular solute-binding protein [Beutenbergia cavernae]ACQ79578.1 extracellular solute-binding protein family 1 [Beutenbergia cavernae DSM 12333]
MSTISNPQPPGAAFRRRTFLGLTAAGVPAVLAACSSGGGTGSATPTTEASGDVLPNYVPVEFAEPDFPSVDGSPAGFLAIPTDLAQSVAEPPGSGATFSAMTPLWGTIPPVDGNQYYEAVNGLLGSTIEFQITDGNVYGDKLATVLASPRDVPDWVSIPLWNLPPRFGSEIVGNVFTDLGPYLAGAAVEEYPNLANLPTDSWRMCVFNGKLYGLPFPAATTPRDATFYRSDLLEELGIAADVTDGDALLALALELTGGNQWGAEDLWNTAQMIHKVPPKWRLDDDGRLINKIETEEYRASLEWNAQLFASGAVHPDAVADNMTESKLRFQSGQSLIMMDGLGGWHEALRDNLAANPDYWQQPFAPFAADGSEPQFWKADPAGILSFLKQTDDEAKIRELLALANVLAAPFGTVEYQTATFGVEGVHYTLDANNLPVPTDLAATELQPTYTFLVQPPAVEAHVQYPGFVEAASEYNVRATEIAAEPLFYAMQISEPPQYASIGQPFVDLEKDISRGRKSMADLDAAIETWRSSGGEELRAFYTEILESE